MSLVQLGFLARYLYGNYTDKGYMQRRELHTRGKTKTVKPQIRDGGGGGGVGDEKTNYFRVRRGEL